MRILQLTKDCLEVALFSNIDAFVTYSGYPSADIVNNIELLDENGRIYEVYISNESLFFQMSEASHETIDRFVVQVLKFLRIYGDPNSMFKSEELKFLFDEFEKQLGVTF